MGIPLQRFNEDRDSIERFRCLFCRDVAEDPVNLNNNCHNMFCRSCLEGEGLPPQWSAIKGFNKRCYMNLKIKCRNYPNCSVVLDVSSFIDHDANCDFNSYTFICPSNCGYRTLRGADEGHSCTQQTELKDLRNQMAQLKKVFHELKSKFIEHQQKCELQSLDKN